MEKRLTETMDSLDTVKIAEPTHVVHPNLIDALEELIVVMSNQFFSWPVLVCA
jgi:hypothetical protein